MDEQEMTVLQLVAEAALAMSEDRAMPVSPRKQNKTPFWPSAAALRRCDVHLG